MVRRVLTLLSIAFVTVIMASCGQTYKLLSIAVTPGTADASGNQLITLPGIGAYQQLTVTAIFSNSKTRDITKDPNTTFQLDSSSMPANLNPAVAVPLQNVLVNKSGTVSVLSKACTVDTEPVPGSNDAAWTYFTYPYKLLVTYTQNGVSTTAVLDVEVINSRYCFDGKNAMPIVSFQGNLAAGWGD